MEWITVQNCPLCGASSSQLFDQRTFRAYPVENRLCTRCGLVYQSPRLSDQALEAFYAAEYRLAYQGSAGPTRKDLYVQEQRAGVLADFLRRWLQEPAQPNTVLDIGCSSGLLLERLSKDFSLDGVGVEPGEAYREYARQRGLMVVAALHDLNQHRFGLVSMIHVLEHLPDPVAYLQNLRQEHPVESGLLLVEVPNLYAHDSFEIAHLTSFSGRTLTQLLKKAGFSVLALRQHGAPRSKVLPLYLTALARSVAAPDAEVKICPETEVRLKRRLGLLRRRLWERLFPGKAWLPLPEEESRF